MCAQTYGLYRAKATEAKSVSREGIPAETVTAQQNSLKSLSGLAHAELRVSNESLGAQLPLPPTVCDRASRRSAGLKLAPTSRTPPRRVSPLPPSTSPPVSL